MNSLIVLKQLFSSPAHGWLEVALLVCLMAALLYRPERIRRPLMFKWACLLFALSTLAPSAMVLFLDEMPGLGGLEPSQIDTTVRAFTIAGPALFVFSFLLATNALMPPVPSSAAGGGHAPK